MQGGEQRRRNWWARLVTWAVWMLWFPQAAQSQTVRMTFDHWTKLLPDVPGFTSDEAA